MFDEKKNEYLDKHKQKGGCLTISVEITYYLYLKVAYT